MPPRALSVFMPVAQAASSANRKKLDMTVTYDKITADLKVRFDRPQVPGLSHGSQG